MAGALAPVHASAPGRLEIFAPNAPASSSNSLLPLDPSAATLTGASAALQLAPNLRLEATGSVFDPISDTLDMPQSYAMPDFDLLSLQLDRPQGAAASASLDWSLSDWAGLSLSAEHSSGALGFDQAFVYKPILFGDKESNSAVGLAAHVQLGNGWVTTFSYDVGVTQLDLKPSISFAGGANQSQGRAYTVAIAKHGLFGDADSLKLSVTRPDDNFVGNLNLGDTDFAGPIDLVGSYHRVTLPGDSSETDVGLGYVTTFFGGALALQANAGYQMNVAGQSGENSLTVLSRAKINF